MQEFSDQMPSDIERYPMVPIRDVVIFPFTKVAFKIGRPSSVNALEKAMAGDRTIFLATQHDATVDEPNAEQIYTIGTLGRIPEIGEKVQLGLAELLVIETLEQRVTRLELCVLDERERASAGPAVEVEGAGEGP